MNQRKAKVGDVMGDMLSGDQPVKEQEISQPESEPVTQRPTGDGRSHPNDYLNAGDAGKKRVTHYFLIDTDIDLDNAVARLKNMVGETIGPDRRRLVSKTLIIERAVKLALEDLAENNADSWLAKDMMRLP